MQHFANFGVTKQANKQLKRLYEMRSPYNASLGKMADSSAYVVREAKSMSGAENLKRDIEKNAKAITDQEIRNKRWERNSSKKADPLEGWQPPYNDRESAKRVIAKRLENPRKIYSKNDHANPDFTGFTDIRRNTDPAINATHLGFRTDPFKGYGGMMEEPVDYKKLILNRGVNRFDMRGGMEP